MNVYENILKSANLIMFIVNPDGIIIDTNRYTTELFDDNSIVGKYFYSIIDSKSERSIRLMLYEKKESPIESELKINYDKIQPVFLNVSVVESYLFIIGFIKQSSTTGIITSGAMFYNEDESDKIIAVEDKRQWQLKNIDEVTGLYNKEFFKTMFGTLYEKSLERGSSLGVISFDIEGLDKVASVYGEQKEKRTLSSVAQSILSNIRSTDFAIKYDDKFLLLIPYTNIEVLKKITDRIKNVAQRDLGVMLNSAFGCTSNDSRGNEPIKFIYESTDSGEGMLNSLLDTQQ